MQYKFTSFFCTFGILRTLDVYRLNLLYFIPLRLFTVINKNRKFPLHIKPNRFFFFNYFHQAASVQPLEKKHVVFPSPLEAFTYLHWLYTIQLITFINMNNLHTLE